MGWDMQAVELAEALPLLRETLVSLLTSLSHKPALSLRCIQRWNLDPLAFPQVTHELSARQLRWLVREGKAQELGPEVCAGSPKLQDLLVRELLFAGELDLAQEMLQEFGLASASASSSANADLVAELAQHVADRAAGLTKAPVAKRGPGSVAGPFLHMPAGVPITFVTGSEGLSLDRAAEGLSAAHTHIVGLDVEFGFTGSSSAQPALLQIATRTQVFLFDLLCFESCPRMGAILQTMFRDPAIRKVGYAWDGDWRVLHGGFPRAAAFAMQTNVVDMADPARALDRLEALREAQLDLERTKLARALQNSINEAALADDIAAGRVVAAVVRNNNNIASVASADDTPTPSADPLVIAEDGGEDGDEDMDMDDALNDTPSASASAEPTNVRAVRAAAKGAELELELEREALLVDGPGSGFDTSSSSSSSSSNAAAANASPSREDRRRAKKVAKKAARSPAPSSASAGGAGAGVDDDVAPVVRKGVARGLSSLAQLCLGLPLDKHYQISAWRRRPLKPEQMHYAALDAFCLLGIYDAFFVRPIATLNELGAQMQPETFAQYTPIPADDVAITAAAAQ